MFQRKRHMFDQKEESVPRHLHRFIGRISRVSSDGQFGFIKPHDIWRQDRGPLGMKIEESIFVHINAFIEASKHAPEPIKEGMVVTFFLAPATSFPGQLTAEKVNLFTE